MIIVKKRESYAVRISGLGEGDHDFSFELDQQFFALFEHSEVESGRIRAGVVLEKKHGFMALRFTLQGEVEVVCDRCLEPFPTEINSTQVLFVRTGEVPGEIEDDVLIIGKDDHEIDVGQFLYEFIILALPFKKVHPEDDRGNSLCNPEMLTKLKAHKLKEKDQYDQTDPRWDVLKGIIEKNN